MCECSQSYAWRDDRSASEKRKVQIGHERCKRRNRVLCMNIVYA